MVSPTAARGISDTEHGLSTTDLELIRDALTGGRKPKVVFTASAGQIAGQIGQVTELTNPDVSDEWIVVRFGRDELPFAPGDLAIPPKGSSTRRTEQRKNTPAPADTEVAAPAPPPFLEPAPRRVGRTSSVPNPREESSVSRSTPSAPSATPTATVGAAQSKPADRGTAAKNAADRPADATPGTGGAADTTATTPDKTPTPAGERRPAKAARVKAPASLTVTLAYTDREWTIAANQGTKALAKPYVIKPAEALKMVAMIDVPGVHDAVENIIATERAEAEQHALRLRAELAEIEARLTELTNGE